MKKLHKLLLMTIVIFQLMSCSDKDGLFINSQISINEKIEIKNGILTFSNSDFLKKTVEKLKSLENTEDKYKLLSSYYDKGFYPLFPNYVEGDSRLLDFEKRKKERAQKVIQYNQQFQRKSSSIIDEDGELVEEYDDDLIADDDFAALLNDKREIIVDGKIYKYTYSGVFSTPIDNISALDGYIETNDLEYTIPQISDIVRGHTQINGNIDLNIPTTQELNTIESCSDGEDIISPLPFETIFQEDCGYGGGSSTGGGNTGGGNGNSGGSTGGNTSGSIDHFQNMIDYSNALSPCQTDTGNLHIWGLFGTTQKCYESFENNKYRTKTKFWKENYVVYKSIGVKVKHQKKGWTGFWRAKATDEIALTVSQATFEYSLPVVLPQNYFQPKFYFFEDKIFNSQSQILSYFSNTTKPPKPELPWDSEITLVEFINNDNLTTEKVRDLFYQGAWFGAKLLVNNYKMRDPNSFTHLIYNNGRVFVNYTNLKERALNYKKIVKTFDYNFNIGFKFNANIDSNGHLTTNINSFGDVIGAISIPRVYDYSNIQMDFTGLSRRGNEWKGSKLLYKD